MGMKRTEGFTILEIMIVVSLIGFLAVIGIPQIIKARETSQRNVCIQNQRLIMDAVVEYEFINRETMESIAADGGAIRDTLMDHDFFDSRRVFECPSSGTFDYDDYTLDYSSGGMDNTVCQILEDAHRYQQNY